MRILAVDTSAGASVALVDGGSVLGNASVADARAHAEQLAVAVRDAVADAGFTSLREAAIDMVAVGTGPAPYTGLRAGLVTARTIAASLGVPVVGVCSLDALARAALDRVPRDAHVLVVTDAKRREVYCAQYCAAGPNDVETLVEPAVLTPRQAANVPDSVIVVGGGAHLYGDEFTVADGMPTAVDAAEIARLAATRQAAGQPQPTEPLYLRRPDVQPPKAAHGATK